MRKTLTKKMTNPNPNNEQLSASFRDPSGFLFSRGGVLYRQVNRKYEQEYTRFMESGLYEKLVKAGLLISHVEVDQLPAQVETAYKIIQPERVPFISYPYEWSFGQLKDAALATLSIQRRALRVGMSLKDASAYNIQFVRGKAALIDTLSFELYKEGQPWVAYRQFCQHFLAPLTLMALKDVHLNQLLRVYIDGVPLDLASKMLPFKTRLNFGLLMNIHVHAAAQKRYSGVDVKARAGTMSKQALTGLIDSLGSAIRKLNWDPGGTEWGNYYDITNYSEAAFRHKKELVTTWAARVKPALVWDLGANNGVFSRLASEAGAYVRLLRHRPRRGGAELSPGERREDRKPPAPAARSDESQPVDWLGERGARFLRRARSGRHDPRPGACPSPGHLEQCALAAAGCFPCQIGEVAGDRIRAEIGQPGTKITGLTRRYLPGLHPGGV